MTETFVAIGYGSSKRLLFIPFSDFEQWLDGLSTTQKEDRFYWHVIIHRKGEKVTLQRKKGKKAVDLTKYLMPEKTA